MACDSETAQPSGPAWSVYQLLRALNSDHFVSHEHFGVHQDPLRPHDTPSKNRNVSKAFPVLAVPSVIWNNLCHFSALLRCCFKLHRCPPSVRFISNFCTSLPKRVRFVSQGRANLNALVTYRHRYTPFPLFSVSLWEIGCCLWPPREVRKNGLNASHSLCVLQRFGCGFIYVKSQNFPLRDKNGRLYFIGFNHLLVLMLVTEIANFSIGVEINCIDPKYFSSGVFLL